MIGDDGETVDVKVVRVRDVVVLVLTDYDGQDVSWRLTGPDAYALGLELLDAGSRAAVVEGHRPR